MVSCIIKAAAAFLASLFISLIAIYVLIGGAAFFGQHYDITDGEYFIIWALLAIDPQPIRPIFSTDIEFS